MKTNDKGSVMLEFVLVMPCLTMMIFGVLQFAYIFLAKQMAHYAAFSAARTALVYNPKDYSNNGILWQRNGPAYLAACTVMSWLDWGSGRSDFDFFPVPDNSDGAVWSRVWLTGTEGTDVPAKMAAVDTHRNVSVTVHYLCPLLIPGVGAMLGASLDSSSVTTIQGIPFLHLRENCLMVKPLATERFPRIPMDNQTQKFFMMPVKN